MKKKVLFDETLKSELFTHGTFLCLDLVFDRKNDPLKWPVFGKFGSELTKTTRDWPNWAITVQNDPCLANLDPD